MQTRYEKLFHWLCKSGAKTMPRKKKSQVYPNRLFLSSLKQSFFRYAFLIHRTLQEAKLNLQRSINRSIFGYDYHVKYATICARFPDNQQGFDRKKIVVRQIPENVTKSDLRYLFSNGRIL
jgi:hypothetical protein